jgi:Tfx family DNA-binding protein
VDLKSYLTDKEVEALELFKKYKSQREVAKRMESSGANISLTLKRAREKIIKSKNTLQQAEKKEYLSVLGITELSDISGLLDTLLNSSERAICIVDRNYRILLVNQATEQLFGNGISDFLGKKCHDVFMSRDHPKSNCPTSIIFKTGETYSAVKRCVLNDGTISPFKITAVPVKDKYGRVAFSIECFERLEEE